MQYAIYDDSMTFVGYITLPYGRVECGFPTIRFALPAQIQNVKAEDLIQLVDTHPSVELEIIRVKGLARVEHSTKLKALFILVVHADDRVRMRRLNEVTWVEES